MKSLILLLAAFVCTTSLGSCEKDDPAVEKTTLQKIQAKWTIQKEEYRSLSSGVTNTWTVNGAPGDYVDFRTDGNAYYKQGAIFDTTMYELIGNDKIVAYFPSSPFLDTFSIQVLNDNQLQLDEIEYYDPGPDYFGGTMYLIK